MKTEKRNIEIKIKYEQYKNLDIYFYKISANSNLIKRVSGYTNKKGLEELLSGNFDIKNLNYTLLKKDLISTFKEKHFFEFMDEVRKIATTIKDTNLNDEDYELYEIRSESHAILDLNGNLVPQFIHLNNPLYLINNNDFNLKDILEIISNDNRFKNTNEKSRYEFIKESKNDISISTIPYYNSDKERNEYINVGFIPSEIDWDFLMKVVKENKLMTNSGYIPHLSQLVLELGLLGFELPKEKRYVTKNLKI